MDDVAAGEFERVRLAEIHHRWPLYGWDHLGRSRWDSWTAEPFLGLGIAGALIATLYFEFALLTGKAEPWFSPLSDLGLHPRGQAAILLYAIALSGVLLQILSMSLSVLTHSALPAERGSLLWFLLWAELIAASGFLMFQPATPLARALETALGLAPLWSLGLFLALGRWLLRPFTFRHLADRRLPRRDRAILAGVALTAALPLGGLAIPFWIYAHHRLWPAMERSWAAARS